MESKSQNKPLVKFCGMTRVEDVKYAVSLGVDAVGMVLVPTAGRAISIGQAQQLRFEIPAHVAAVAVVQNPDERFVRQVIKDVQPDFIQFHGDENLAFCEQFDMPFWKAISVRDKYEVQLLTRQFQIAGALVYDAWSAEGSGGHGIGFDWGLLPVGLKPLDQSYILAGGLNADTIQNAHLLVQQGIIDMFDVSSGIEELSGLKGYKSHKKMNDFMKAVSRLDV